MSGSFGFRAAAGSFHRTKSLTVPLAIMLSILTGEERADTPRHGTTNRPRPPTEVLEEIFAYLWSHDDVWNAAQVSCDWRIAAHSHRQYYLPINIDPMRIPDPMDMGGCITKLNLGRNPLWKRPAIQAAINGNGPLLWVTTHIKSSAETMSLRRVLEAISHCMPRIKGLTFHFAQLDDFILAILSPALSSVPAPRLETLQFFITDRTQEGEPPYFHWPLDWFQHYAPGLRALNGSLFAVPGLVPAAFCNLEELIGSELEIPHLHVLIAQFPRLRKLCLNRTTFQVFASTPLSFVQPRPTFLEELIIELTYPHDIFHVGQVDLSFIKYAQISLHCAAIHELSSINNRWLLRGTDQPLNLRLRVDSSPECFLMSIEGIQDKGIGEICVSGLRGEVTELCACLVDIPILANRVLLLDINAHLLAEVIPVLGPLPLLQHLKLRTNGGLDGFRLNTRTRRSSVHTLELAVDEGALVTSAQIINLAAQAGVLQEPQAHGDRLKGVGGGLSKASIPKC